MYPHAFLIDHKNADIKPGQVSYVMQLMSIHFQDPRVDEAFRHVTIIVTDEIDQTLDGYVVNGKIVFARQVMITDSIGKTAIPHELLHVAIGAMTGDTDHDHQNKLWTQWLPKFKQSLIDRGI